MASGGTDHQAASTVELLHRLVDNIQSLIDTKIELATVEIQENIQQAAKGGRTLGIGAFLLFVAFISLFHFLYLGIDTLFPRWGWLAALLVMLVTGIVGALIARKGGSTLKIQPLARTRATLKEDAEWVKHPTTLIGPIAVPSIAQTSSSTTSGASTSAQSAPQRTSNGSSSSSAPTSATPSASSSDGPGTP